MIKLFPVISLIIAAFLVITSCSDHNNAAPEAIQVNETLRRENSFFGLHFDFHAAHSDDRIGETLSLELIDSMLSMVKPDYVQIDCKGHAGISSYPTRVAFPAPGFVKDPYPVWREATRKHSVALFVHYSGVWDIEAVRNYPEWALVHADGKRSTDKASVRGPYVDNLLIPQLKELIDEYDIDGAWVDGECWALEPDYSMNMIKAFAAETGITNIPRSASDKGWYEFQEFNRKSFREYIAHYVNELHSYKPGFQLTSNWAFSSLMPEPVDIDIDFISGDYTPSNSVYSGLYEARCIAPQGKPWDLMAWSFTWDSHTGTPVLKSPAQLMQAAATVISMGGGYQIYFQQNRDASIKPWTFRLMKDVADFCRERQAFCTGTEPLPQIALLYSTANFKMHSERLYSSSSKINDPIKGVLNMLLDRQNAVEILMEHHLTGIMADYPLIVVPECMYLTDGFIAELLDYVDNGGNLLVIGPDALQLFQEQLQVEFTGTASSATKHLAWNGQMAGINSTFQDFNPGEDAVPFGQVFSAADFRFPSKPAATITSVGKGKIAGVYFNMGRNYLQMANPVYRDFIHSLARELFPEPIVEVSGTDYLSVTVNRLDDKLAVNLINMSGEHANTNVSRFDEIPPVGPLQLKIRIAEKPKRITLQPENIRLKYKFSDGVLTTDITRIDIHSIIIIE